MKVKELIEKLKEFKPDMKVKTKILQCANCKGNIIYGDEVIVKKYNADNKYFCCNDCLAEYEGTLTCYPDDNEYNKLFCVESE